MDVASKKARDLTIYQVMRKAIDMRRALFGAILALGGLAFLNGQAAQCQPIYGPGSYGPRAGVPITNPVFSPWTNLLRGGSFLGNYWGLVRPEFAWRGSVGILQQQTSANQQAVAGLEGAVGFPTTGHPTQFLNTSHYFLSRGGQVGGGGGALTQRTQMQSPAAKAPQGGARGAPATRP